MRRPAFQFYPADWAGNSNLKRCTHEEKGIWIDVMCILHDQDEYGVARWTAKELALAVGCTVSKLKGLISKGVLKGADPNQKCDALIYIPRSGRKNGPPVTLIEEQQGPIWYSSRMVIDEYKRKIRGGEIDAPKDTPDNSPKGGIGENFGDDIDVAPKATPDVSPFSRACGRTSTSTSTSSSTSTNKEKTNKKENSDTGDPASVGRVCSPTVGLYESTDRPPDPASHVSPHGAIAAFVRSQGMNAAASDQELRDLITQGATMGHFVDAVPLAKEKRKGWKYLLGIVRNMLQDERAPPPARRQASRSSTHEAWERINETLRKQQEFGDVIDGEITVVDGQQSHGEDHDAGPF